ncbi:MAG: tetratricopeptide repeat protein [Candidatus Polarisedimenticolaceae bacterium]|nr:tetratricopeptide repeat protein [Candidatus Polarisedimenticolaceae bacterium]
MNPKWPLDTYPYLRCLLLGGLLLVLTLLVYWPGMQAGFYFDDLNNIVEVPALHWDEFSLPGVWQVLDGALLPGRVLSNLSFALNHLYGGLNPAGYHWVNLIIHLLVGMALVWVAVLFSGVGRASPAKLERRLLFAILATALFLLHPLNIQAVTYVVQRMTSLATLFTLLSFGCYLTARLHIGARAVFWFFLSAVSFLLALGNKEIALMLPLVLLLFEVCFYPHYWRGRVDIILQRTGWVRLSLLALFIVGLLVAGFYQFYYGSHLIRWNELFPGREFTGLERVLTEARVQFFYLGLLLWPDPSRLNLEHDFLLSTSLFQPWTTALSMAGLLLLLAGVIWLCRRSPRYGFPLLAYAVFHLLESGPINLELVFEHRMYLPMAFLVLLISNLLVDFVQRGRWPVLLLLSLLLVPLSVASYQRNMVWSEPLRFLRDCATKSPNKFRPWYNLGTELGMAGIFSEAEPVLLHALKLKPGHSLAHNQLGNVYLMTGRQVDALLQYRYAVEADPKNFEALFNLATQYYARGAYAEAVPLFQQFIAQAPPPFNRARQQAESYLKRLR